MSVWMKVHKHDLIPLALFLSFIDSLLMCTAKRQDLCWGTDANVLGVSHLGPLMALLGLHLPRVYASDSTSAQTLPQHIGKPEFPDTGRDRIKDLFSRG